ncbi:MAG: hypothetical protein V1793_18085 [Pseudomonadota bacterium]
MIGLRTCVSPSGTFVWGVHRPAFTVTSFRGGDHLTVLGKTSDGTPVTNHANFPPGSVEETGADRIYEIHNAFPFRGTTYVNSAWADRTARDPSAMRMDNPGEVSFSAYAESQEVSTSGPKPDACTMIRNLPRPLRIALADTSTDPRDLICLAGMSCTLLYDQNGSCPSGLGFITDAQGAKCPDIKDHVLFDCVVNNRFLPDAYKEVMVLRPGVQGSSEITGEWRTRDGMSHVYEYLRRNSYIPWGHFAANTAQDTVRYRAADLTPKDMTGMRHLYYQRIYAKLGRQLGLRVPEERKTLAADDLEGLRLDIRDALASGKRDRLVFNGSLWGWNFGFGYAQSGYRLHASHQQIHQQYAMIPRTVAREDNPGLMLGSYACGDLVADWVRTYRLGTGRGFFNDYLAAIRTNQRVDGSLERENRLDVFADDNVMLFVPKAQTSQWELQLIPLRPCGNCLEADYAMRRSLDRGILVALQTLESMGASMVTSIEFSKRFDDTDTDQQVLFSFLPKVPESPGAFSEAQLRWISGHYPEDFAEACRRQVRACDIK